MKNHRTIEAIIVAAVPPPYTGQSIAAEMLLHGLSQRDTHYKLINMARPFNRRRGLISEWERVARAVKLSAELTGIDFPRAGEPRLFYLQMGHGLASMLRDAPLLRYAERKQWPVIAHIHGGDYCRKLSTAPKILREFIIQSLKRIDSIVVLSEIIARQMLEIVPKARVKIVPNGVPLSFTKRVKRRKSRSRRIFTALFLSNIIKEKGYETVMLAARIAATQNLPIKFILAGAETERMRIHPLDFIQKHGLDNMRYVGFVNGEKKHELFEDADVLVLPSETEGQPIVILEAMHYGLPIIATPVGGIPDIVQDSVNGFLIPVSDPTALLSSIMTLQRDPGLTEMLSQRNLIEAQQYTEEEHCTRMLSLFDEVALHTYGQCLGRRTEDVCVASKI